MYSRQFILQFPVHREGQCRGNIVGSEPVCVCMCVCACVCVCVFLCVSSCMHLPTAVWLQLRNMGKDGR